MASVMSFKYKAAQTDRNTTATATDDPDLIVALTAGKSYRINLALSFFSTSATPGIRYAFGYTSTLTQALVRIIETTSQQANASTTHQIYTIITANITTPTNFTRASSATANTRHRIQGSFNLVVSGSGNFSVKWAQSVSNGTNTSLVAGSHMIIEEF